MCPASRYCDIPAVPPPIYIQVSLLQPCNRMQCCQLVEQCVAVYYGSACMQLMDSIPCLLCQYPHLQHQQDTVDWQRLTRPRHSQSVSFSRVGDLTLQTAAAGASEHPICAGFAHNSTYRSASTQPAHSCISLHAERSRIQCLLLIDTHASTVTPLFYALHNQDCIT